MAARGILTPLCVHTTAWTPPVIIPPFITWLGRSSGNKCVRLFCTLQPTATGIDMSNYAEKFSRRMAMAGIRPHHRLAIAVSGGPDSIALCVLTAAWKYDKFDAAEKLRNNSIDGLLAIIVDHGLRAESGDEASLVYNRVLDMGIQCVVARCEWLDGRPKLGHLQEAARSKRYEILQNICIQQKISILMVAHHADDQAELFIMRLSRSSGVLGLAGMAFVSQIFAKFPYVSGKWSNANGILLVRPLLEFTKADLYKICRASNQHWVEDPTNKSPLYARNRIRMSLNYLSSSIFKAEVQSAISACRRTRVHVDRLCHQLLDHAVMIMPHGYAVIDLGNLRSMEVKDIYLAKLVALLMQFISQRHKPVRGSALKLLMAYLRTFPCKTSLDVAGCYLCPAPGSKGTKVLVCCSVDSCLPMTMELFEEAQYCSGASDLDQIVKYSKAYSDSHIPDSSSVPFLDITSSDSVLDEAKRLGILGDFTYRTIISLQKEESDSFRSKAGGNTDLLQKDYTRRSCATLNTAICPGQVGYFMNRFVLDWKVCDALRGEENASIYDLGEEGLCFCKSCFVDDEMVAKVRNMVDADWIYLYDLSKKPNLGERFHYALLSARRAIVLLKPIPISARRSMPVLVNSKGALLSVPSIGFSQCAHLMVSAVFSPRIHLGGGYTSFL